MQFVKKRLVDSPASRKNLLLFSSKTSLLTSLSAPALLALLSCGAQEVALPPKTELANNIQQLNKQQVVLETQAKLAQKSLAEQRQSVDLSKARFEEQVEEASQRLEQLTQEFVALKPQLPEASKINSKHSTPTSVVEFLLLNRQLEEAKASLAVASHLEAEEAEFSADILALRGLLRQVHSYWSQLLALELKTEVLKNGVLLAQEAFDLASTNNWRVGAELALYFFGFKWLWGVFSWYSPTTSTSTVQRQLNEAREALKEFRLSSLAKQAELELGYQKALAEFKQEAKLVLAKPSSSFKSRDIERLLALLPQFFEEARELTLRDILVGRKAHERGQIVASIHRSRVAREEWELEGFTVGPSFLFNVLLSMASKTVDTNGVYSELKKRVKTADPTVDLNKIGFRNQDTALLLDLIVYMALENVAFYRTLDLNTCGALLSWLDYEYLNEEGEYEYKYRDQVVNGCKQLETLLKAWTSGLDRVLELYPTPRLRTDGALGGQVRWRRSRLPDVLYDASKNPFYVSGRNAEVLSQRLADIFLSFFTLEPTTTTLRSQEGEEAARKSETSSLTPPFFGEKAPNKSPNLQLPSVLLKENVSEIEGLLANTAPSVRQEIKSLFSSPSFLADAVKEKSKELAVVRTNIKTLEKSSHKEKKFYELLSRGEREARVAKTTYGVLLRREAELSESREFVRLKAEELKHTSQSHWSMPKEIALYLFGFKWLWGAFTGYAPTVNTSKLKKELLKLTSSHRSLELSLTPKINRLREEFESQKAQALELLNLAEQAAPSFKDKETVLRFSQTFRSLFGDYELASQKFEAAKAVFVQAQYNSWEHFSGGGKTVWGDYNLTGEVAQTLSEGLYTKEEIKEGEESVPKPPLTTKERHEAAYEGAKKALAQAARSFNSFFEAKESREVARIFRRIEKQALELERLKLLALHTSRELARLKLRLNQERHRDKNK